MASPIATASLTACVLAACEPNPTPPTCEEQVCTRMASCSPVLTGVVDFRTPTSCLESDWTCSDPDACLAAVAAVPCLSNPPTEAEIDATSRALGAVRIACLGYQP